jgi:hypothetical protein
MDLSHLRIEEANRIAKAMKKKAYPKFEETMQDL